MLIFSLLRLFSILYFSFMYPRCLALDEIERHFVFLVRGGKKRREYNSIKQAKHMILTLLRATRNRRGEDTLVFDLLWWNSAGVTILLRRRSFDEDGKRLL